RLLCHSLVQAVFQATNYPAILLIYIRIKQLVGYYNAFFCTLVLEKSSKPGIDHHCPRNLGFAYEPLLYQYKSATQQKLNNYPKLWYQFFFKTYTKTKRTAMNGPFFITEYAISS
ncbi:MAG: hypothetical protein JWQ40_3575, partial [Segetibacter sp.]|nr:hypothetical protein [Segetibacter sp.]